MVTGPQHRASYQHWILYQELRFDYVGLEHQSSILPSNYEPITHKEQFLILLYSHLKKYQVHGNGLTWISLIRPLLQKLSTLLSVHQHQVALPQVLVMNGDMPSATNTTMVHSGSPVMAVASGETYRRCMSSCLGRLDTFRYLSYGC